MTALEAIRAAHQASGATVTELADVTGISRARLGEWLSRAKPGAKYRRTIYAAPSDADVRAVAEACLLLAKANLEAVERLLSALP